MCLHMDILMMVILASVRWYLIVVFIYISLIIVNIVQFFICLLTICMSFLENYLFPSSAHFFFLYFWYWAAYFREYFVYYLLSVSLFANIFCQFFVVVLLMTSFAVQKFLSLVKCHLLIFAFISITLGDSSQNILLQYVNRCFAQRKSG